MTSFSVSIQTDDFDLKAEADKLRSNPNVGAVVSFVGSVRDNNLDESVTSLELEHYPSMTEKTILAIIDKACARWSLSGARVIHRIGKLSTTDQIVLVVVSSAHRGDAFQACEFIMDFLKTDAPFWKKETTDDGERWVEARESDETAADRWSR